MSTRLPRAVVTALPTVLAILLAALPSLGSVLTASETRYLQELGPVSFCVDPDWPPYEIIGAQGRHEGIAADLLRLAASRVGLTLTLRRTRDWEESLAASKAGDCMLLSFLNQTPKREAWLIFTEPLFVDPNVIVTREGHPFIADLAAVSDETMVLPEGTSIEERLRRDYPDLGILLAASEAAAFAMVSEKRADMTLRSLTVAVHTIKKEGWFNLRVSGQMPGYENRLRIGVAKGLPMLRDILNKGIAAITAAERGQIANRHVAINVQAAMDYGPIGTVSAVFLIVVLTNLYWIVRLRQSNRQLQILARTDRLTGLVNRGRIVERIAEETERAARYDRPVSIILVDLDHFKRINDEFGHLMGDRVLVAFAAIAKAATRSTDATARWGGEEFLILCPETTADQALLLARRLCAAVRTHAFPSGRSHTVSAGVTSFVNGDTVDGFVHRADDALYLAKHNGRDQACLH